jgi:hypothetical protein
MPKPSGAFKKGKERPGGYPQHTYVARPEQGFPRGLRAEREASEVPPPASAILGQQSCTGPYKVELECYGVRALPFEFVRLRAVSGETPAYLEIVKTRFRFVIAFDRMREALHRHWQSLKSRASGGRFM